MKTQELHMREFKDEYKRYFESKLAITLSAVLQQCNSVKKVSQNILVLLERNKDDVVNQIAQNNKIRHDLYSDEFYGHLPSANHQSLSSQDIYAQIVTILASDTPKYSHVIHIQAAFIYRIYDHLTHKSIDGSSTEELVQRKAQLCSMLYPDHLFKDRGRIAAHAKSISTTSAGICRNRFFNSKLKERVEQHSPAMFRFAPDQSSPFVKKTCETNNIFIAGASGHTGSLLLGALLYGDLRSEELNEYVFACATYLINGGNHSLHECMLVAREIGVPYTEGNYNRVIPPSLKATNVYENLAQEFPQFLEENSLMLSSPPRP